MEHTYPLLTLPSRMTMTPSACLAMAGSWVISTVNLSLCGTASTCVITVSDSGPGVPEEELPYVFDRFYTSSGAANPQGTGLGLFIANQIAQQHNADIHMENKAESGCRITVVFWKYRPGNNTM